MAENNNRNEVLLAAFVAGGLLGAGLAVLFAPESGEETRKKLSDLLEGLKEKAGGAPPGPPEQKPEKPAAPEVKPEASAKLNKLAEEIRRRKAKLFRKPDQG